MVGPSISRYIAQYTRVSPFQRSFRHTSYKVAKKVIEFEYQEEIPRTRLRAAYGDGFKGAPLRCELSSEGSFPQDAGMRDGKVTQTLSA